jgi:hypothetical protein
MVHLDDKTVLFASEDASTSASTSPSNGLFQQSSKDFDVYQRRQPYFIVMATSTSGTVARPTCAIKYGKQFIDCFTISPQPVSRRRGVGLRHIHPHGGERLMRDLFVDGYVDHAIFRRRC